MFKVGMNGQILHWTDLMMEDLAATFRLGELEVKPTAGWMYLEHTYTWKRGDYYYHPKLHKYFPIVRGVRVEASAWFRLGDREVYITGLLGIRAGKCFPTPVRRNASMLTIAHCCPPDKLNEFDSQLREAIQWTEHASLNGKLDISTAGCGS